MASNTGHAREAATGAAGAREVETDMTTPLEEFKDDSATGYGLFVEGATDAHDEARTLEEALRKVATWWAKEHGLGKITAPMHVTVSYHNGPGVASGAGCYDQRRFPVSIMRDAILRNASATALVSALKTDHLRGDTILARALREERRLSDLEAQRANRAAVRVRMFQREIAWRLASLPR